MKRTNIVLDETLIKKAIKVTGLKSRRETVHFALSRLVDQATLLQGLKKLQGKLDWHGDLNKMRKKR